MADEEIPFVPAGDKKPSFFEAFRADLDRLVAEQVGIPHSMFHSGGVVGRRNDKIPFLLDREHKVTLTHPHIFREKAVTRPEVVITVTHEIDSPLDNLVTRAKTPSTPAFIQMLDDIERVERTPATQFREAYVAFTKKIQGQIRNNMERHLLNSTYGKLRR